MSKDSRTYDVVVWGATGFTGKLVAEYMLEHYHDEFSWAIAGRSQRKLEALRSDLTHIDPRAADLPILTGDSFDGDSLRAIAQSTKVVCTTVGPYAKYGAELVAACVEHGTDYCDLTGEPQFMRAMIDAHHEAAKESGARIVHTCGYDSIPSDIGTYALQQFAVERAGAPATDVTYYMWRASGGFSGGTIASAVEMFEQATKDKNIRRVLGHPYSLNPQGEWSGEDGAPQSWAKYDRTIGSWTGPFVMASVNEKVVRRAHALSGYPFGKSFRYREVMRLGRGLTGMLAAYAFSIAFAAFAASLAIKPLRNLLAKYVLPKPGEGPSDEAIAKGFFETRLVGKVPTNAGSPKLVEMIVKAKGDPGYGATSMMLSESAVCLAKDDAPEGITGGVLPPSVAMGEALLTRLRSAGMTFQPRERV
ncbi:MAG: saccharopine dehydrogenase NADP-binding domain-containing protein [Myxococcota bacterium]